jgi:hypothetical protein
MNRVLIDKKSNAQLIEKGYVVVDFLSQETIAELNKFYRENPNPFKDAFHTTHFSTDTNYKKHVQGFVFSAIAKSIEQTFSNYYPVFANFMVKEGGGNNPMPLHADWTYVDESKSSSYAVWLPLIDTTIKNGCIGVIPFSHKLSYSLRGPRILQWEPPVGETLIENLGQLLPMKAGRVLIYNHRTLHYSTSNNSDEVRPAINISLMPKDERIFHYTLPEGQREILKFSVADESFFLNYNNFQMPESGMVVEKISPESIPLLNEKAEDFIRQHKTKSPFSVLKKFLANVDSRFIF